MSLQKEQNLIKTLKENKNLQVIQVITTNQNFEKRFDGSISFFFKQLKNGLFSINSETNRSFFKGISGVYFSLEDSELFEIIIINDTSYKTLNRLQVITRLKKLLGIDIQVNFGEFEQFEPRIREMIGIKRKTQTFGDYYKSQRKIN